MRVGVFVYQGGAGAAASNAQLLGSKAHDEDDAGSCPTCCFHHCALLVCSEVAACKARIGSLEAELAAATADNSSRLAEQQKAFLAKLEQLRQVHAQQLSAAAAAAESAAKVRHIFFIGCIASPALRASATCTRTVPDEPYVACQANKLLLQKQKLRHACMPCT
jgi:hypothetical protein